MQIGPYTIHTIETGEFALDGGAMFGIVPRPLWEKKIGVDARNRIDMRLRCLLIRGDIGGNRRVILVDTGIGTKWDPKECDIYRIDHSRHDLVRGLARLGVTPDDVTDVILTHCHFDHAGGATTRQNLPSEHRARQRRVRLRRKRIREGGTQQALPVGGASSGFAAARSKTEGFAESMTRAPVIDGRIVPTFAKATYYVQQAHWAYAQQPTEKDRGSFLARDFLPLMEAGQLTLLPSTDALFPGISFRLSHGHTTALQHPFITDGRLTLFYCADLIPTSLHVHVPWVMAYDIRPLDTIAEKQAILAEAARDRWILVFEHCPLIAAGRVVATEKGYRVDEPLAI